MQLLQRILGTILIRTDPHGLTLPTPWFQYWRTADLIIIAALITAMATEILIRYRITSMTPTGQEDGDPKHYYSWEQCMKIFRRKRGY